MENPNYSHGPIIPLISGYIVFQKIKLLKDQTIYKSKIGIVILFIAFLLYLIGLRTQVKFIISYSFIAVLSGLILLNFGKNVFKIFTFPIFFLLFMVPFWVGAFNKISNLLKLLSSIISQKIIELLGYSIYRDGVVLNLTNGVLEVADPCSGIRSLLSLLALGTIMAYYSKGSLFKKILLVILTMPIAVIWNSFRVIFFGIVLETSGVLISEGFLHTVTGLAVFMFAFLSLIAFEKWIKI